MVAPILPHFLNLLNKTANIQPAVTKKGGEQLIQIGRNVKRYAKMQKIPIYLIERQAGLGNGCISKWNTSSPSAEKLKRVADVLGITVDTLLKE